MYGKRIGCIVKAIPQCKTLADIGCDHGYIGISAMENQRAERVLFSDISLKSLEKAKNLCEKLLIQNVEFFCADGTQAIADAEVIVIGGMGGREIISILDNCKFKPKYIVLQPMKNMPELRQYLEKSYFFEYDETVFDKKFYQIMRLVPGCDKLTEKEVCFGKTNLAEKSDDFKSFIKKEIGKTKKILDKKADNMLMLHYLKLLDEVNLEVHNGKHA